MIHEQLARPKSKMEPWATTRALCLVILLNLSTVFGNQILEGDGVCQRDEICPFFEKNVIINYFLISLANILAVAEISRASAASKQETIPPPLAEKKRNPFFTKKRSRTKEVPEHAWAEHYHHKA